MRERGETKQNREGSRRKKKTERGQNEEDNREEGGKIRNRGRRIFALKKMNRQADGGGEFLE